ALHAETKAGGKAKGRAGAKASESEVERIRALPYVDFVEGDTGETKTGVTISVAGRFQEGYTLVTHRGLCRTDLIDAAGSVVHTWVRTPCHHWDRAELLPGGDLLVMAMDPLEGSTPENFDAHSELMKLSWDGRLIEQMHGPIHHSFQALPDGRILTLTVHARRVPAIDPNVDIRDESVAILDTGWKIEEELSLYDVLAAGGSGFHLQMAGRSLLKRIGAIDLIHSNNVEMMPFEALAGKDAVHSSSSVLVTLRHQDALVVIDLKTRKLVWAWGQNDLLGPHDGTWLANGNILVFDNGTVRHWSRVVEVDPSADRIVWQYKAPTPTDLFTRTNGGAQRLPDGNTLITETNKGRGFEVTPGGEVVWKYVDPRTDASGRRSSLMKLLRLDTGYVQKAMAAGEKGAAAGKAPQQAP
ncbi:MAG TPA: arylsulfotransferase family protein, partial [Candidatus Saccharimonadales bacterium]|nr:arylsulfotransferase family protein [Candidatus Saccharimonadales bacterium]